MKVIAFGASSSRKSINKKFAAYAAGLLKDVEVEILDLNDYELPLFSQDKEKELGKPDLASKFLSKIGDSDAIIISFAEHNGSYSVAYKNLFDWCSRVNPKVYQNKPMIILSTSPGPRGGAAVLAAAISAMPFFDGNVKGSFSLPNFFENFDQETNTVSNTKLASAVKAEVEKLGI